MVYGRVYSIRLGYSSSDSVDRTTVDHNRLSIMCLEKYYQLLISTSTIACLDIQKDEREFKETSLS